MVNYFSPLFVVVLLCHSSIIDGGSLDIDKGVVVQLFEWKYKDIAVECEAFLAPHGYAAVQISPPQENLVVEGRPWWERYQPVSYKLRTRSDTKRDLANMISRCNAVGVRVFADVVLNHMTAPTNSCLGTAGSVCNSRNLFYPGVPYMEGDFHHPICDIGNYDNATEVRICKLVGLNDLNQTIPSVRDKIARFMNHLENLGVGGFRMYAAKHIYQSDLQAIYSRLDDLNTEHGFPNNTKPAILNEVTVFGKGVMPEDYISLGFVTEFRVGSTLGQYFQGYGYLKDLRNFGPDWGFLPENVSFTFNENHDTERTLDNSILTFKKPQSYKMSIAFLLSWGYGTPRILSSYNFTDINQGPPHDNSTFDTLPPIKHNKCVNNWLCQHRWPEIYQMVTFHNVVKGEKVQNWWDNGKNQIAFCRGDKGFIAFNLESHVLDEELQTCLPAGTYTDLISGQPVDVDSYGVARVVLPGFYRGSQYPSYIAIHTQAKIKANVKKSEVKYQRYEVNRKSLNRE